MKKRVWKRILVVLLVLVVIVGAAGLVLVKSAADMVPRMQKRLEQATSCLLYTSFFAHFSI